MNGATLFQWASAIGSWSAVACGVRVIFIVGRLVERLDDHGRRLDRLERWRDGAHAHGD